LHRPKVTNQYVRRVLTIRYDGSVNEISKSSKYLGVSIDDDLLFKTHVQTFYDKRSVE